MATATRAGRLPTRVSLPDKTRSAMIQLLNQQLADTIDLYTHTKQAHWNVRGSHFIGLHKLFDEIAERLELSIDELAERATVLGGLVQGTARVAASKSRLTEYPLDITDGVEHLEALADRFGQCAESTREAIDSADEAGDADTADLLTDISRQLDKDLWFLEAHLQA
jgi:starvation-inducible DNA-binding protein